MSQSSRSLIGGYASVAKEFRVASNYKMPNNRNIEVHTFDDNNSHQS